MQYYKPMSDAQLFMAIVIPVLFNGVALTIMASLLSNRMASMETRFDLLTGKVMELSDRVARVEERLNIR